MKTEEIVSLSLKQLIIGFFIVFYFYYKRFYLLSILNFIKNFILSLRRRIPELVSSLPYSIRVLPEEISSVALFLFNGSPQKLAFFQRLYLLVRFYLISLSVHCLHRQSEMLRVAGSILSISPDLEGCVVEAGSYKGGSAAKLSIACKMVGRELVVFDSFEGFPEDDEFQDELSRRIHAGSSAQKSSFFKKGLRGNLEEVKGNVEKFGFINSCKFVQGWFKDTMPSFNRKISMIYLDVDLASSAKACLKYLYPLLEENGTLFSHDGAFPPVVDVFDDDRFWENEVGFKKPAIAGLRKEKLIKIVKAIKA